MYRYIHILICHMYTKSRAFLGRNRPHKNRRFNRSLRVFQDAFVEHKPQKGERLNLELFELITIHHLNSCHSYFFCSKKDLQFMRSDFSVLNGNGCVRNLSPKTRGVAGGLLISPSPLSVSSRQPLAPRSGPCFVKGS